MVFHFIKVNGFIASLIRQQLRLCINHRFTPTLFETGWVILKNPFPFLPAFSCIPSFAGLLFSWKDSDNLL